MTQKNLPHFLKPYAFIAGEFIPMAKQFPVQNPATGDVICDVSDTDETHVIKAIEAAHAAHIKWAKLLAFERADILLKWRDLIVEHKEELARLMTMEQGKPLSESRAEIAQGDNVRWAAEEAVRVHGVIAPSFKAGTKAEIFYQPVGVVAAITPWNFPHSMITRKVAPALAAGCAVVLKPAEDTPLSALALAALAHMAGVPAGVFNVVPCSRESVLAVGEILTTHKLIRKISFTGSTIVGKKLMAAAAQTVKNISLELGGNAPFIIFNTAQIDRAVSAVITAKFRNAGQTCICANRVFIQREIYETVKEKISAEINKMKVGDGLNDDTILGPLINVAAHKKMQEFLKDARDKGAVITGPIYNEQSGGYFCAPAIIDGVTEAMRVMQDEIFGPLLVLVPFENEDEVIRAANDTNYGLAAYIHTGDAAEGARVARALDYGMIAVNDPAIVHHSLPFGGMKESGLGREGGPDALKEFLEVKTLVTADIIT